MNGIVSMFAREQASQTTEREDGLNLAISWIGGTPTEQYKKASTPDEATIDKPTESFVRIIVNSSIAEGFAGFEGVGDAGLGQFFAAKRDEGFAFEVEDVLFADELRRSERAAGEDVG